MSSSETATGIAFGSLEMMTAVAVATLSLGVHAKSPIHSR